jgi:hypothetical protein
MFASTPRHIPSFWPKYLTGGVGGVKPLASTGKAPA